ncbi:MAG: pyridoxal phosphate-dependent aminotransferase [Mediterranea sp.]|jgi:cystathionine beta-lyase|nr:pyridoxal phosphate-dependent aminotransferase [Mediterranea sp.]
MEYNFDEIVRRRGTGAYKWDSLPNDHTIPMWVADMDFRTAPPIIEALARRVEHGVFGYAKTPAEAGEAVSHWFGRRHGFDVPPEWLLYTTGVVSAVSAIIMAFTRKGDRVIIQPPVYNCFFSNIRNNDCEILESELTYSEGRYTMDFDDLERKAADPKAKIFLLCNPHNPAGRVWTREELTRVADICRRHDVLVLSDEIHCDLAFAPHRHIPFASIDADNSITCSAPTKTFNIAGLHIANIWVKDVELRRRVDRALNINEVCDLNAFATDALIAAYNQGEEWLDALKLYLWDNYLRLKAFFHEHLPSLTVLPLEGTYLVWVDCSALGRTSDELAKALLADGLKVNEGTMYGAAGEGFIRLNIACPRQQMLKGLDIIKRTLG